MTEANSRIIAGGVSVIAGIFMAVQARANGGLGLAIENGLLAALFSFTSGLVLISLVVLTQSRQRASLKRLWRSLLERNLEPWSLVGGAFGGLFVMTQGLAAGVLGIALFTVGVVAGQTISALVVDGIGFLGLEKRSITGLRVAGTLLAIFGLIVTSDPTSYQLSWLLILPFAAGIGTGFQQALNSRLGKIADSPLVATLVNFVVGSGLILVTTLIAQQGIDFPTQLPTNPLLYIGGVVGVTFIFAQVIVVPRIGTLATSIALLFGQLAGSLMLDVVAPVAARQVSLGTVIGIALVTVGGTLVLLRR